MDYEKVLGEHKFPTYEELSTGLIRLIDEGKISREDAARLLPELRESEDERIRTLLVALVQWAKTFSQSGLDSNTVNKMLSYLEKQKEQPISAEEVLAMAGLKPYKDGNQWCILAGDNIQEGICGFGDTIEDALYEFLKEVLDLQKEQKPADYPYLPGWRKNRDDNKPELKRSVLMLTTHGVAEGEWLGEKWCQYRWSCGLKDYEVLYWMHLSDLVRLEMEDEQKEQKEQNPAEEIKDQRQIYFMIEDGRRCGVIEGRKQVIDNPEKYGLQKPAEWSEEDEAIINVLRLAVVNSGEALFRKHEITKQECINFVNSLRPSWKPSGELLDALHTVAYIPEMEFYGGLKYKLRELYEHLINEL